MSQEKREKAALLKDYLARLETEENKDEIQKEFNENFASVSTEDIAAAEELLMQEGSSRQDIGELCSLHTALLNEKLETPTQTELKTSGHPAQMLIAENKGLTQYLDAQLLPLLKKDLSQVREEALAVVERLTKWRKHYDKKDLLLFPYLEKAGITGPSTVMWENEERNKTAIKRSLRLINNEQATHEELLENLNKLYEDLTGMMKLEQGILLPMVLENVTKEEWVLIAEEALAIGYVFQDRIEGAALSDANTWLNSQKGITAIAPTAGDIKLPTGSFNTEQLRAVLNTLELDLTVIDHDDKVLYYNEMEPRYFGRTRTIIGRNVFLCHPPQAIDTVKKILDDLKASRRKSASFYFPKGDLRLLIHYYGLYDDEGRYLGCLEAVQNLKPLEIYFQGSKTKEPGTRRVSSEEMAETTTNVAFSLSLDTKLNELLKAYPEAETVLKNMSPKYKQLDNPVMRAAMGQVASLRMIAKRGAFDEEEFMSKLKAGLGL